MYRIVRCLQEQANHTFEALDLVFLLCTAVEEFMLENNLYYSFS